MSFFDFHHHSFTTQFGIYNLKLGEKPIERLFSAGIHPNTISDNIEEDFIWLREVSQHLECVSIGECGLDGLINVDEKLQEEVFTRQIYWANEIKKPIIIHCVRKFHRLSSFQKLAKVPMIVHGFNKRKSIGDDLLQNQFYLSFGRSVLYDVNLQAFLIDFPIDRMFLETDSAALDHKDLYEKVADLKNIDLEDLTQKIKENLQNIQISI